jgi:hypothetical protein
MRARICLWFSRRAELAVLIGEMMLPRPDRT